MIGSKFVIWQEDIMFSVKEFNSKLNEKVLNNYTETIAEIDRIKEESLKVSISGIKEDVFLFFNNLSKLILKNVKLESILNESYFVDNSFEELMEQNHDLYMDILPDNYEKSYANPKYSSVIFGQEYGPILSGFYSIYMDYIDLAYKHKLYRMYDLNKLFIAVYELIKKDEFEVDKIRELIQLKINESIERDMDISLNEEMNSEYRVYTDIPSYSDFFDLRYLFRYGRYISEADVETAKALNKLPQEKIDGFAEVIAKAYLHGFISQNRDRGSRGVVKMLYAVGQERVVKQLLVCLKNYNLKPHIYTILSSEANKQFNYDHRFDNVLYITEEYINKKQKAYEMSAEKYKKLLVDISGMCGIVKFGEEPFIPESKGACLKLSDNQNQLMQKYSIHITQVQDKYIPKDAISFCKVGLPSYEIGEKYDEILEAFIRINMMDSSKYEYIQQLIIDALDKGDYIHIKGKNNNLTDIKVKLKKIQIPEKQTNFLNCGADLNIPLGEVFTTPVLKGTNGILNIEEIYIQGFRYINLMLRFENGYITQYDCKNFKNDEENKKYIRENLLHSYDTLPIGEFAIGSNTLAYTVSKKYNIVHKLPILIVEKMGPHFAIGDPCYSWSEENPIYNLIVNKEIISKENEKTAKRRTNVKEAYTNIHTDLTLPYDSVDYIIAVAENGKVIDIMRNGRFVLEGTELLNEPFINDGKDII